MRNPFPFFCILLFLPPGLFPFFPLWKRKEALPLSGSVFTDSFITDDSHEAVLGESTSRTSVRSPL